jgi:ABC-type Zn2+ transport system substrate-binding protein/surface adhesin
MSTSIDWTELIKDRKGAVTKDNQSCGNIIGDDEENIIIEDGAVRQHFYRVPKSAAGAYNGAELTLNISYDELKTYEDKDEGKGILESITGTIKDKTKSVKEKTIDKVDHDDDDDDHDDDDDDDHDDDDYKEHMTEKRFDQDTQTSIDTNNLNRENQGKKLNRNIDSGEKSDESSTNVGSSFTCEKCNTKFTSRQELKEHFSSQH